MDIKNFYCRTCAISTPRLDVETGRICRRDGQPVKDEHFCGYHTRSLHKCECCGQEYIGPSNLIATLDNDNMTIIASLCSACDQQYGKCQTCTHGNICSFETDPSSLPKVVTRQIKQGNMTAVTQVLNPERMAITCQKGCPCWNSSALYCSKQNHGTCQQYHIHLV
jgi:hypothetical protein